MFDFTINIVAYNNYEDILNAIESINRYTSNSITKKLNVIDNSCKNNQDPVKNKFIARLREFDFVEYIDTKSNLGFGAGNNYNIHELDSRLHIIMNPDILFTEDTLVNLNKFMEDQSIGMCVPKILDLDGNMQLAYRREITLFDMFIRMFCKKIFRKRYAYHTMQDQDYSKAFVVPFAQGSFLVIRTELYKKLGGFDDRYFMYMEDADLCKRVNQVSKLVFCPDTTVIHKWEKGSHKNKKLFKIHIKSMISYFRKWGLKVV